MTWDDIHDPSGKYVFSDDSLGYVMGYFSPENFQKLIDEKGIEGMMQEVNQRAQEKEGHPAFKTELVNGQSTILQD